MKNLVLIDGSNFYYKLKEIGLSKKEFDFKNFCKWLTDSKQVNCTYYVGAVKQEAKNAKSKKLYSKQRKFLSKLDKQGIDYVLGYIMKSGDSYHEKGVDVKIAVDLLVSAFKNKYDKFYLVSSDTDLIPAIQIAIEEGKVVEYVGFSHQPSYALIKYASSSRIINKSDIEKFIS